MYNKLKYNKLDHDYCVRSFDVNFETNENSRTIYGLAIPVNSRSEFLHEDDGNYYEIILPEAVNEDLIKNNDVKIYVDHDYTQGTYARSKYGKGSLKLFITEQGLEFEFEAPNSVFGDALLEGIRRGDYSAVSFGFFPDEEYWDYDTHYIRSFSSLLEISILSLQPAFSATEVDIRSLREYKNKQNEEILSRLDEKMQDVDILFDGLTI